MTTKPIRQTTQEPLDDEERELMNPDNWDWDNPIEVRVVGTPGAVLRVRFTRDEYLALARIARDAGVGPVAFIHQTMLELIAKDEGKGERNHKRPA
jgi:hypothetical protein